MVAEILEFRHLAAVFCVSMIVQSEDLKAP